MSAPST